MISITIFGEDIAHEKVLVTLIERIAQEEGTSVSITVRSCIGGHGRMKAELKDYLREMRYATSKQADLLVIARDANCLGYASQVKELKSLVEDCNYAGEIAYAIPDPHIERWLLLDPSVFKRLFRFGCQAPDKKCDRDRYKILLEEAIRKAGFEPMLGGIEFAEEIIQNADIKALTRADPSIKKIISDLQNACRRFNTSD